MTKKFTINCDFNGQKSPFTIYIGKPDSKHHPLHFQSEWLSKNRGGIIPGEVMEAIAQLQSLAVQNNVELEDLCVYALGNEQISNDNEAEPIEQKSIAPTAELKQATTAAANSQLSSTEEIDEIDESLEDLEPLDANESTDSDTVPSSSPKAETADDEDKLDNKDD